MLLIICQVTLAQDTVFKTKAKETQLFNNIEKYSKKRKFTAFFHRLLFRDYDPNEVEIVEDNKPLKKKKQRSFEGKIIRNIDIQTLDPFGFSIENEKDKPTHFFEKFGNSIHRRTRDITVENFLLFKKFDRLDGLKIKESERIIRSQRFARSVTVIPKFIPNCKDSVDVFIRVLDSWSLIPTGAYSSTKGNINLNERNFLGLGHEFEIDASRRFADNSNGYSARYSINNFKNSFVNTSFGSSTDLNNNNSKFISVARPFYSVFANWGGGAAYQYRSYTDFFNDSFNLVQPQSIKLNVYDFWVGHSTQLYEGRAENARTTNLIVSAGFKNLNYIDKPALLYDTNGFYGSERLFLTTVGITTQKFNQDKYLFNFGIVEDVPYGKVISITSGVQNKNESKRAYFGGRFAYGQYYNIGYFSFNTELGTFFDNGKNQETTFKIEANYFTHLIPLGSMKIRQFINPYLILGYNRNPISKDRINVSDYKGIPGLNATLTGTKKVSLALQTQLYIPKNWYGFNFSPFINCSLGFLGDTSNAVFNKRLYSSFGIGAVISNNYLIFNNFQISFSYIPSIPDGGSNILKTNSFQNSDLQFSNFQINQPGIVPFR